MKQVWIPRIGPPEVLELRDVPEPQVKQGEVKIRVKAAGINFADLMARMGLYLDAPPLPSVVGYEVAGEVEEWGEGVGGFTKGDRVLSLTRFGGYSEVVCVPAVQALPLPDQLSFEKAAALPVTYLTAWLMLVRLGNVQPSETVLVHALAGGVGQAALQIATHRGARVIGTASASKHERLKEMGALHCVDYQNMDFEKEVMKYTGNKGVDIVLDALGGHSFQKSYNCLSSMGRLFLFGASSTSQGRKKRSIWQAIKTVWAMPKFKAIPLMNQNRGVFGVNLGHLWDRQEELSQMTGKILSLVGTGEFDPVVDRCFPFEEAGQAHDYIQSRKNFGKVLLVV